MLLLDKYTALAIGDVAWKRHQRLGKILGFILLTQYGRNQQSCFKKKTLSCNTPAKLKAILFAQHTLAVMRTFHTA